MFINNQDYSKFKDCNQLQLFHKMKNNRHNKRVSAHGKMTWHAAISLAVHMVNDGWAGLYDCAIVLSNDGDHLEALKIVHDDLNLCVGLITPGVVKTSKSLLQYTTFRKRIRKGILGRSQLPDPIPKTNIHKPKSW